jgi:hypothetical protein
MTMKIKLTILTATALAVASSVLFSADVKPTKTDAKIEEIKWRHKLNCDLSRSGIQAGYLACRLGLNLTNYLADVEAAWDKQLKEQIAEASKH